MKKLLAALLVLVMLAGFAVCLAEEETPSFVPSLTNAMESTTETWYSTGYNRALLTALLGFDLMLQEDVELGDFMTHPTYVALDDETLTVMGASGEEVIMVMYSPSLGIAFYYVDEFAADTDSLISTLLETVLDENNSSYKKNEINDMVDVLSDLNEAMGEVE